MKRTDNRRVKISASVLGGTALIAMGIIGAWAGGVRDGAPAVAVPPVKATFFGEG